MSLLKQIAKKAVEKELIEDAAAGATSAGAIAGVRAPMGGVVRRKVPGMKSPEEMDRDKAVRGMKYGKAVRSEEEEKETDWNKEVRDFRKRAKKDKGGSRRSGRMTQRRRMGGPTGTSFSLTFEDAINSISEGLEDEKFDPSDVISKLRAASAKAENEDDTTGFALEDTEGNIVKVYVASNEAEEFERALGAALSGEDDDDEDIQATPLEIAEVLFKLKDRFAIVDVVWPPVEGDPEEQESTDELDVDVSDEEGADAADPEGEGEDLEGEGDDLEGDDMEADMQADDTEAEAASALSAVIDMLKSQADATKAEAQAREAEANAEEAKYNAQAAEAKVRREEEVLDMEAHEDKKKKEEQEAKKLKDLARFRHEQAQKANDMMPEEEEEKIPGSIPGEEIPGNKFEPGVDENRNRRMEPGELLKYILRFQKGQ